MSSLLIIARNTFQDARHNKVIHIAGGFAAILIVFSFFLGEVSLYQNIKVVKDVGMATISLFGVFVAIFIGVNSLYKELELRTVYTIISKPISRHHILLGKFLGMAGVLLAVVTLMTIFLYMVTFVLEFRIDFDLIPAIFLIWVELLVVAAAAMLFSSFSTPFLSGFFTFGLFWIGRVSYELGQFGERSRNPLFKKFATTVQKVFDLEAFNIRTEVVHRVTIYAEDIWLPCVYALLLLFVFLGLGGIFFQRRDFK